MSLTHYMLPAHATTFLATIPYVVGIIIASYVAKRAFRKSTTSNEKDSIWRKLKTVLVTLTALYIVTVVGFTIPNFTGSSVMLMAVAICTGLAAGSSISAGLEMRDREKFRKNSNTYMMNVFMVTAVLMLIVTFIIAVCSSRESTGQTNTPASEKVNGHFWSTTYGELLFQYLPKVINEDDPQSWGAHRVKTLEKFTLEGQGREVALHLSGGAMQMFPVSEDVNARKGGRGGSKAGGKYAKQVATIVKLLYPHSDKDAILRDTYTSHALPDLFGLGNEYCHCSTAECGDYVCNMIFAYKFLPPQRYAILIEGDKGRAITKVLRTLDEMLPAKVFELEWVDYAVVDNLVDRALAGIL